MDFFGCAAALHTCRQQDWWLEEIEMEAEKLEAASC